MKARTYIRTAILAATILLGASAPNAEAQLTKLGKAQEEADLDNTFIRGKIAPAYDFVYNGTWYWSKPDYITGKLFYKGKQYENVLMNIDACKQVLLVKPRKDLLPVVLETKQVSWFTLSDSLFVNMQAAGWTDMPKGFYKVEYQGEAAILKQVTKALESSTNDNNGDGIGYYDRHYNYSLATFFHQKISYWYVKGENAVQFRRKSDFANIYQDRKKEYKSYVRSTGLNLPNIGLIPYATAVVSHMERSGETTDVLATGPFHKHELEQVEYTTSNAGKSGARKTADLGLPAGWFDEKATREEEGGVVRYTGKTVTAIYRNKLYELGDKTKEHTGKAVLSGRVTELTSEEPIVGVVVYDDKSHKSAITDANGKYSLTVPVGENVIHLSEATMEETDFTVIVYDDASLDMVMKERSITLESAMISAESRASHRTPKMGVEKVNISNIKKFPTAFGEGDVLKVVQTLPGVKSVGEASGGINVRGGSTDQNLILFNENTIYNPTHLFGLFSAFNPDIVENLELYKSSIPAEYGGRISSVLDVRSKSGSMEKVTGSLGIGLLTSHGYIEGPLNKGKTSFLLSGRTTYSNWLLNMIPESSSYHDGSAQFSDANIGITHKFADNNTLQANAYWSRDAFSFNGDTTFNYSNLNASLKWKRPVGDATMVVSGGFDHYGNEVDDNANEFEGYTLNTSINQAFAKALFTRKIGEHHTLNYGGQATFYSLMPGKMSPISDESLIMARSLETETGIEPGLWISDTWQGDGPFSAEGGLRLSSFLSLYNPKFYANPEVRISGKYSPSEIFSLKAGFNNMSQYIHLVSNTASVSPMDTWKLCGDAVRPQTGWQMAGGAYWTVAKSRVDLSLEGYWKRIYHYLDYKSGATLVMNPELVNDLVETTGKAYGVEFMVKKPMGKLNGWISYTWSRTMLREMEDRGIATINKGNWYPAAYDKPHDVKVVANYKFTHRYSISANFDYSTGRPVTIPVGKYKYAGGYRLAYSERNGYRIPDYCRLDLAMNIEPSHYLRKLTHFSITFGVYNALGRKNAYSVYYTTNGGGAPQGRMISVFATQIPYLNINVRF